MKELGVPIKYDKLTQTFYYNEDGTFVINFQCKELYSDESCETFGGTILTDFLNLFSEFD